MPNLFSVDGKVAVVTGASRGLGRAIAGGFLESGASVVGASRSAWDVPETEKAVFVKTDISNPDDVDRLVETTMDQFGQIDILVNNAGVEPFTSAGKTTLEEFDDTMAVNVRGAFHLCREASRDMLKRGSGKIINIASVLGMVGFPDALSYTVSKGAVIQMTRTLAVEWGPQGVNVNCIAPGFFNTDLVRETLDNPVLMDFLRAKIPCGRTAEPEEIVGTVLFLASKASDYVHGAVVVVDGGETATLGYTQAILDRFAGPAEGTPGRES